MSDDESDDFRSSSDDDSDYEETTLGKRSGKKGIAGALKKRKGTRSNFDSDDSDDDDSGSESEEEEFSFEYGPDGYKDQEDYMALMKKPEFERESILAERLEKRSAAEDLFMKKKKLREQKRAVRRNKQPMTKKDRLNALNMKKRKGLVAGQKKQYLADQREASQAYYDDGEEFDTQRAGKAQRRIKEKKEEPEATYEQVKQCQVKRYQLEKWVFDPFFEKCVVGTLVRVRAHKDAIYVVAEIRAVQNGGFYTLEGASGKHKGQRVNQRLICSVAGVKKPIRINFVSNQTITEKEFFTWFTVCKKTSRQWRLDQVEKALEQIEEAKKFVYSTDDIDSRVALNQNMGKFSGRVSLHRVNLQTQLTKARAENNQEEVARITKAYNELASVAAKQIEESGASVEMSLSDINRRNRKKNTLADLELANRKAKGGDKNSNAVTDVFARRETRPMVLWATRKASQDEEKPKEEAKQELEVEVPSESSSKPLESPVTLDTPKGDSKESSSNDDTPSVGSKRKLDLHSMHDFDLDIELDLPSGDDSGDGGLLSQSKNSMTQLMAAAQSSKTSKRQRV
eukprot:TRINITY_DN2834_c0_g2_i2.p1 TRINITY_DN2834_c0_g2~~TRINITY_DN2834_c0_g2_i2.p1  ORF type:complete len:569 (+),score=223.31 TRINITY_DN2834_c0_g2_i2:3-1709(+)